jgi:hypothetical protein
VHRHPSTSGLITIWEVPRLNIIQSIRSAYMGIIATPHQGTTRLIISTARPDVLVLAPSPLQPRWSCSYPFQFYRPALQSCGFFLLLSKFPVSQHSCTAPGHHLHTCTFWKHESLRVFQMVHITAEVKIFKPLYFLSATQYLATDSKLLSSLHSSSIRAESNSRTYI